MVRKARIRLTSTDYGKLEEVCEELKVIAQKTGVKINGPVPLPTKRLRVPVLKSPCGEGTSTWDKWEMRFHKRLIDVDPNERFLKRLMRIRTPDNVFIEIELVHQVR
jgi:small subunit ribosomal protein S10